jgi:hypothetical protein
MKSPAIAIKKSDKTMSLFVFKILSSQKVQVFDEFENRGKNCRHKWFETLCWQVPIY